MQVWAIIFLTIQIINVELQLITIHKDDIRNVGSLPKI